MTEPRTGQNEQRRKHAWTILEDVRDPEIPAVSVVDLGIVREVEVSLDGLRATATITPTYSGCPAMHAIEQDVGTALRAAFDEVEVRTVLSPAWTTDWITERGRRRLREAGIAPPPGAAPTRQLAGAFAVIGGDSTPATPECPRCGSDEVARISEFGSTACKSLWRCTSCQEPFDTMKPL